MPKIRTLFNPGVAMVYLITNLETGEQISAATCGIKDINFKPWRSPKGTPHGKEFFKMKLGSKKDGFTPITFINSSMFDKCVSDDGKWEFTGDRPDGGKIYKLTEQSNRPAPKKKETTEPTNPMLARRVKSVVEKIKDNNLPINKVQMQTAISNEEFVAIDEINSILK